MREGIRLGRVFGIRIVLDYSWLLILVLMVWNLTAVFSRWHPTWGAGNLVVAIIAALLFFASIIAHELGHALVALAYRVPVREIRLFLFGGVSDIGREPPSPLSEFLIAIAGPAVSFAIGFICLAIADLFLFGIDTAEPWEALATLGPLATIVVWLGPINLVIGVFNLVPGFPLDGGRVLRAALWRITNDLHKATRWAATVGQTIGWTFVVMGIAMFFGAHVPLFGSGAASGLWLAFIGWFLSSAAGRSYQGLLVQEVLEGVQVAHLMKRTGRVMPAETTVAEAVTDWFMRTSEHAFPVFRGEELVGLVAAADVRRVAPATWSATSVEAIMTPVARLAVVSPTDEAQRAIAVLAERDVEQLPVLLDGRLVGMLERGAIARWLEMHLAPTARPHTPRMA